MAVVIGIINRLWYDDCGVIFVIHEYLPIPVGDPRKRVQDLLLEKGASQATLAKEAGIPESTLSRFMKGKVQSLSHTNVIAIARYFNVSTDFLLGLTNIPYRTNYQIDELGLSADAAEKLYKGEMSGKVLSQLLEHPKFSLLMYQIEQFKDENIAAGTACMNEMLSGLGRLARQVGRKNPALRKSAVKLSADLLAQKYPPFQDTAPIEGTFKEILRDLQRGAVEYMKKTRALTADTMERLLVNVEKRGGKWEPGGLTEEQMADAILDSAGEVGLQEEHRDSLRPVIATFLQMHKEK